MKASGRAAQNDAGMNECAKQAWRRCTIKNEWAVE